MFKPLFCTAALLGVLTTLPALAMPVAFSSDGSFSNLQNQTGGHPNPSISSSGDVLDMGGGNNSTLTANDFSFSGNTELNDQAIGKITWVNRASTNTDPNFNVTYSLVLKFTAPNADVASQNFALTIQQPTNPPGDSVSGLTITGLPTTFALNGVTVSDFKFSVVSGYGLGGSFANGVWSNPDPTWPFGDSKASILQLTADFKQAPATQVPEPASFALLAAGLLGLDFVRRVGTRRSTL